MTTRLAQEQFIEDKNNQWTLGRPTITSKMGSPSASTATSTAIWQKNAEQKKKERET